MTMIRSLSQAMPSETSTITCWKHRFILPHLLFCGLALSIKLLFPRLFKWLAYDTITTIIISVWYPLCCTISLIHKETTTHGGQTKQTANAASQTINFTAAQTTQTSSRTGKVRSRRQQTNVIHTNIDTTTASSSSTTISEIQFWLDYWSLGYSLSQFVHKAIMLLPVAMKWSLQYTKLSTLLAEIKLIFFLWIFTMEPLLDMYTKLFVSNEKNEQEQDVKEYLPLSLIKRCLGSSLIDVQTTISEPISKENWQRYIHSKANRVLNLIVALQFLSEEWCDYLLLLLDEGRSLLLLSPFLIFPAPITKMGILYVQFILPTARSLLARGKTIQILSLQYWILNNLLSVGITSGSWLWWFLPFSTQIIFALWCYLTFPRTITEYYTVVQTELITFGILSGESQLTVEETKTIQAIRAVVKRLPSANDAEGFQWAETDNNGLQRYKKNSQRKLVPPRSHSAPATLIEKSALQSSQEANILSSQKEEDYEIYSEVDNEASITQLSKSFSAIDDDKDAILPPSLSLKGEDSDKTLPPSMSMLEESDDSSQLSMKATINFDVSEKQAEAVEVMMANRQSPSSRFEQLKSPHTTTARYQRTTHNLCPSPLSRLTPPASLSNLSMADTVNGTTDDGLYLSDIDTAASGVLDAAQSFDSSIAICNESKRIGRRPIVTPSSGTAQPSEGLARRSPRLQKLSEKSEHRKLNVLTESLLFMRTMSSSSDEDEIDQSKNIDANPNEPSVGKMRGRRNSSSSFASDEGVADFGIMETPLYSNGKMRRRKTNKSSHFDSDDDVNDIGDRQNIKPTESPPSRIRRRQNNFVESSNTINQYQSALPRYVRVDAAGVVASDSYETRRQTRSSTRLREKAAVRSMR